MQMLKASVLLGVIAMLGCSGAAGTSTSSTSSSSSSGASSSSTELPDAGEPDAGPECTRRDDGTCLPIEWTYGESAPAEVDHHGTFIHALPSGQAHLYVVGGVKTRNAGIQLVYDHVLRAQIGDDGNVTGWTTETPLPVKLAFHATTMHEGRVYLLAGVTDTGDGPSASTRVYVGTPDDAGHFTWATTTALPQVVRTHATANVLGGKMYFVGGGNSGGTTLVNIADVHADGTLGTWSMGPALPQPRSHHGSFVHDGRIYLVAGFDDNQVPVDSVVRSVHDDAGVLTGWEIAGVLENPPWTPAVFTDGRRVFVMGGGEGRENLDTVRVAEIGSDGILGAFTQIESMPEHRSHVHQAPYFRGRVYSVGGREGVNFNSNPYVLVGRVN